MCSDRNKQGTDNGFNGSYFGWGGQEGPFWVADSELRHEDKKRAIHVEIWENSVAKRLVLLRGVCGYFNSSKLSKHLVPQSH